MLNGFRLLLASGLVALIAWACCVQVNEGEVVVVARFGDPRRTLDDAGLYFTWPPPLDTVVRIDRRVQILDPGSGEYLTKDKKNIIVDPFMAWRVVDHLRFMKTVGSMEGAGSRLTDVLRSITGDVLASHPFTTLVSIEGHAEALDAMLEQLTAAAKRKCEASYGVEVVAVRLKRFNFPAQNKQAVFTRMQTERQTISDQYRAEGDAEFQKIKAEADRQVAELVAEAQRKATETRGNADAEATRIYAEAYGKDSEFFAFTKGLEVFETMLTSQSTLVIPNDHPLLKLVELSVPKKSANDASGGESKDH